MREFDRAGTIKKDGSDVYAIHISDEGKAIIGGAHNPNIVIDGEGNPVNIVDFSSSTPPPRPLYKDKKEVKETIKLFEEKGFTVSIDPKHKDFFC